MDKTDEIIELLKSLNEVKKDHRKCHRQEHEYLRLLIEEHKQSTETWLLLKRKIATGGVLAAMAGLFGAILLSIKHWITSGM